MELMRLLGHTAGTLRNISMPSMPRNRRKLLLGGAAAMAAAWRQTATACTPTLDTTTRWLANRLTFGATPQDLADAASMGYNNYLEYQLDYANIDDSALEGPGGRLANYTTLTLTPAQMAAQQPSTTKNDLVEATLLRAVLSKRQLFQRMVEFWTDHFNIDINNGLDELLKTIDDRDVIRANAMGTFPALLSASAHSPAMLYYLNNDTNQNGRPNENYARELMELHTLGVTGGYTQQDVQEVARCFTGWTFYSSSQGANAWSFRYQSSTHDNGAKTVLGQSIPANGGMNDAVTVLNILANHPSTANFIATKLCTRFWGYNPPAALVNAVASTYMNNGSGVVGDIKSMLRTLFNNTDPMTAPAKYKRPFHFMSSVLRATGATVTVLTSLRTHLSNMGQLPFYWSPPDGYADTLDAWVGLILPRWNFAFSLANNSVSGVTFNTDTFLGNTTTNTIMMDAVENKLYGTLGIMPAGDRSRVQTYLLPNPPSSTRRKDAVGLSLASPGFQWY